MTKFETHLFIGGCADGRRIDTDFSPIYRVPNLGGGEHHNYRREKIRISEDGFDFERFNDFVFYRYEGITFVQAFTRLFGGYMNFR